MSTLNDLLANMKDIQDGVGTLIQMVRDLKDQPGQISPEMQAQIDDLNTQAEAIESSLKTVTGQSSQGSEAPPSDTGSGDEIG